MVDCATRIPPREERVAEAARMDQQARQRLTSDLRILNVLLCSTANTIILTESIGRGILHHLEERGSN